MLEVIDKGTLTSAHPTPLLFVHGAWHAAWCWDEGFMDFFVDNGYRAVALSLRGHGSSPSDKPIRAVSTADYVDDIAEVARTLPTPPVVIGHSMGGYLVQKYLEAHAAPAAVLLASVPARGLTSFLVRWTRRQPWLMTKALVTGDTLCIFNSPDVVREKFFSPHTPEDDVVRCKARLQRESRRMTIDASVLHPPRPDRVKTPVLVVGAGHDGCFTVDEVRATARAYGSEAVEFPEMGHDMMIERGWPDVAEMIRCWLAERAI
jgi:pimeloyl-ACP methyl ester carboxylesterase